ncbi:MAG: hypothetical protein N2166_01270 [candidate division WOR-3 bacterium]|nr:hypothetical protein [candidate division WOR-3 bacterium]
MKAQNFKDKHRKRVLLAFDLVGMTGIRYGPRDWVIFVAINA